MVAAMPTPLTLTADTPRDLLAAGLAAVLGDHAAASAALPADVVAVPVRGKGQDLTALFIDLVADLEAQVTEWGSGLDHIALDGVLRTETGAYTAWGYLTGRAGGASRRVPTLGQITITAGPPLTLTVVLIPPA